MSKAMTHCFQLMNSILGVQIQPQMYQDPYHTTLGVHGHVFHGAKDRCLGQSFMLRTPEMSGRITNMNHSQSLATENKL